VGGHIKDSRKKARFKVNGKKYKYIAQDLGYIYNYKEETKGSLTLEEAADEYDFLKLLDLVRTNNRGCTPEIVEELTHHYVLDISEYSIVADAVNDCLDTGKVLFKTSQQLDFTDMIWLPTALGYESTSYGYLFCDENQDLNNAQRDLLKLLTHSDSRIIGVGDKFQSILGFCGSSNDSTVLFKELFDTTELPLSTCYRCPVSHLELVNTLFPEIGIEPTPDAPVGSVEQIKTTEMSEHLTKGDLILCRLTAPLISKCIQLISEGINAKVKGRDIGQMINKELELISKIEGFEYSKVDAFCEIYLEAKAEKLKHRDNVEDLLTLVRQKIACILAISDMKPELTSVDEFQAYCKSLFTDDESPVMLSTIHKAKGLEADRVFIIEPERLPLLWCNQQKWEYEQELNLLYVALTRAKSDLFIVGDPHWYSEKIKPFRNRKAKK
jgi:superfamily I DNA/RNA helicase